MVHRAILGSYERFLSLLIEHFAGAFPVWLSPVQVKILSVGEAHHDYCQKLAQELRQHQLRVETDTDSDTINYKIRKATGEKVPYVLVIGDKEVESDKLSIRDRGQAKTREVDKKEFIKEIKKEINNF